MSPSSPRVPTPIKLERLAEFDAFFEGKFLRDLRGNEFLYVFLVAAQDRVALMSQIVQAAYAFELPDETEVSWDDEFSWPFCGVCRREILVPHLALFIDEMLAYPMLSVLTCPPCGQQFAWGRDLSEVIQ